MVIMLYVVISNFHIMSYPNEYAKKGGLSGYRIAQISIVLIVVGFVVYIGVVPYDSDQESTSSTPSYSFYNRMSPSDMQKTIIDPATSKLEGHTRAEIDTNIDLRILENELHVANFLVKCKNIKNQNDFNNYLPLMESPQGDEIVHIQYLLDELMLDGSYFHNGLPKKLDKTNYLLGALGDCHKNQERYYSEYRILEKFN